MFNYEILTKFRNARFGNKIITFDDLIRERNLVRGSKEYHVWLARKDKKDYLLLDEDVLSLPLKVEDTEILKDEKSIFHFVKKSVKVGFLPEKYHSFRELVDYLSQARHSNKTHQKLMWMIALGSYFQRLNVRICTNIEFGKDSTFITLNYLTNAIAVFDKPRTVAKLEYGLINRVLMINELVPSSADERYTFSDFLLSVGSLNPSYAKKTRSNAGSKEVYDTSNLSLVICYNTLSELTDKDKENYFDMIFSSNVIERFIPFKFNGKLDINQFRKEHVPYSEELDGVLMRLARSIEWYKQNWKSELKPYNLSINGIKLSGRRQEIYERICDIINLYSKDLEEYNNLVNELAECYIKYERMLKGNNILSDYERPKIESKVTTQEVKLDGEQITPEVIDLSGGKGALAYFNAYSYNGQIPIDQFLDNFSREELNKLCLEHGFFVKDNNLRILK